MKKSFLAKLGSALLAIMLITACNGTEEEMNEDQPTEDQETNTEDGQSSEEGS